MHKFFMTIFLFVGWGWLWSASVAGTAAQAIILSSKCPSHFQKKRNGYCQYTGNYSGTPSENVAIRELQKRLPDALDPEQIDLGRYLFFDPILSKQQNISCAHCHNPARVLSDGKAKSQGPQGKSLSRSSPSLWNVGLKKFLFWDGRAQNLEDQVRGPLFSPDEMDMDEQLVVSRLLGVSTYRQLFHQAFGQNDVTFELVAKALATFERTLISFNSRFDTYFLGQSLALTPTETEGLNIFRSFVTRCAECHTPPLFTNDAMAVIGAPDGEESNADAGIAALSLNSAHTGAFRVPSIRNVDLTAPYMHSGGLKSLPDVVHFYNAGGGHALAEKADLRIHWHIRKMGISKDEEKKLVAFLGTLTDVMLPKIAVPEFLPSGLPVLK